MKETKRTLRTLLLATLSTLGLAAGAAAQQAAQGGLHVVALPARISSGIAAAQPTPTCMTGEYTTSCNFGSVVLPPTPIPQVIDWYACNLPSGVTCKITDMPINGGDKADFKITSNGCKHFVFNTTQSCPSPGQLPPQYCEVDYEFDPEVVGHLKAESKPKSECSPYDGGTVEFNWSTLDLLGTGDFAITLAPQNTSIQNDFPLADPTASSPGSVPITFGAIVGKSQTVTWNADLSYMTSGSVEATAVAADQLSFKTKGGGSASSQTETITGLGGEMAVSAKAGGITHTATGYVTGILASAGGVPNSLITNQLEMLYDGLTCSAATSPPCPTSYQTSNTCTPSSTCQPYKPTTSNPILLAQVATLESGYAQFVQSAPSTTHPNWPPYGIAAFWPNESPQVTNNSGVVTLPAGSYIGLMQVPLPTSLGGSMYNAWDWLDNTEAGQTVFQGMLAVAAQNAVEIQAEYTGLTALNSEQLENMALVLYNEGTGVSLAAQYYAPQCTGTVSGDNPYTCSSGWQWIVNTAGNPCGVAYVSGGTCTTSTGTVVTYTGVRNETLP
jgi:hypothetical protein